MRNLQKDALATSVDNFQNLQQDRLTSEDLFYALGTFLVTFSFSVGRLFTQVTDYINAKFYSA